MKLKFRYIVLIISGLIVLHSCKTTKITSSTSTIKSLSALDILANVEKNNARAETYSIKYNAKVKFLNKKQTLNGLIRIKTDSIIWISIGPSVGIELMRVVATKDSLKYINKTNNTYYLGTYNYLKNLTKLNFDYKTLECIMLSQIFAYNSTNELSQDFQFSSIESNAYVVRNYKEKMKDYLKTDVSTEYLEKVYIDPINFTVNKIIIKDKKVNRNLTLDYENYQDVEEYKIPEEIHFNFDDLSSLINVTINYQKVSVNSEIKLPFKINKKFTAL